MAETSMDYEGANGDRFDDEPARNYDDSRRSASPRNDDIIERRRSASPPSNGDRATSKDDAGRDRDRDRDDADGAVNPGSNLFVTGIHPRLTEPEVTRLFEKYGEVEKCQIMRDPHTKESRGFGFVKMMTSGQADAAKDALQGYDLEGRSLSIEKARRARPRTPTPGKYFGPPKREGRGGPRFDNGRYDDRRRGGGGGGYGSGREDPYRYRGYERRYEDRDFRGGPGGYGGRDDRAYDRGAGGGFDRDYPPRRDRDDGYGGGSRLDRYSGRDDRYPGSSGGGGGGGGGYSGAPRGDDRRGDRYERDGPRSRDPPPAGYGGAGDGGRGDSYGGSDRR